MSLCCQVSLILFSLLAGTILESQAIPVTREAHCLCSRLFSYIIPAKYIAQINIYAAGPYCTKSEVVATTTDGTDACLDAKEPWVKAVIKQILERVCKADVEGS
ncbi:alveolar macrophage chemotactic factor-like [Heteronotia binoei]|uniref:alveolar macrophage chemotactic factor-like n=1 Tax=Heteronotia binoei TaxID=13085 RepID=UPI002931A796|nr:alveolar macrophage chemotactic factor-like [Heteronotia binoei]